MDFALGLDLTTRAEQERSCSSVKLAVPTDVLCGVGQEGQVACTLDRARQLSLVPGTQARLAPWLDLAPVRDVPLEHVCLLVINCSHAVGAEFTSSAPSAASLSVCQ